MELDHLIAWLYQWNLFNRNWRLILTRGCGVNRILYRFCSRVVLLSGHNNRLIILTIPLHWWYIESSWKHFIKFERISSYIVFLCVFFQTDLIWYTLWSTGFSRFFSCLFPVFFFRGRGVIFWVCRILLDRAPSNGKNLNLNNLNCFQFLGKITPIVTTKNYIFSTNIFYPCIYPWAINIDTKKSEIDNGLFLLFEFFCQDAKFFFILTQ